MRWIAAAWIVGCAAACGGSEPEAVAEPAEPVAEAVQEPEAGHVAEPAGEHAVEPHAAGDSAAAARGSVETRAGGLVVRLETPGSGPAVALGDALTLHYRAFVAEQEQPFDATEGVPLRVVLGAAQPRLIEGLTRGLVGLRAGAHARLEIPPALAWGTKGNEAIGVPADAALVYDVRVVSVGARSAR